MRSATLSLLFAVAIPLQAGEVEVCFIPPTTNVDGSPVSGIIAFEILLGREQGKYDEFVSFDPYHQTNQQCHVVGNRAPGDWYIAMIAIDLEGDASGLSNEVVLQATGFPSGGRITSVLFRCSEDLVCRTESI